LYPEKKAAFHRLMDLQFAFSHTWLDVVDLANEFASVTGPETILFVDIGGGNGHQCEELLNKYPDLQGRVILEDQEKVIKHATVGKNVERLTYDYITEQPVRVANIYYLRQVLSIDLLEKHLKPVHSMPTC
jgi:trans-aconitate methyltransferase